MAVALRDKRIERVMFDMAKNSLQDLTCYGIKALDKLNTFRRIPLLICSLFSPKTFLLQIFTAWFPYLVTLLISPLIFQFGLPVSTLAYSSTERNSNNHHYLNHQLPLLSSLKTTPPLPYPLLRLLPLHHHHHHLNHELPPLSFLETTSLLQNHFSGSGYSHCSAATGSCSPHFSFF